MMFFTDNSIFLALMSRFWHSLECIIRASRV